MTWATWFLLAAIIMGLAWSVMILFDIGGPEE